MGWAEVSGGLEDFLISTLLSPHLEDLEEGRVECLGKVVVGVKGLVVELG